MIDTSDGLSTDLGHICAASGVGAVVWKTKLPAVRIPENLARRGFSGAELAVDLALNGGEDYELLFTVPKKLASRLPRAVGGVPITVIGEISREEKVRALDENGKLSLLRAGGWDPFRKK